MNDLGATPRAIALVDDQVLLTDATERLLAQMPEVQCAGVARTVEEATARWSGWAPALALVDGALLAPDPVTALSRLPARDGVVVRTRAADREQRRLLLESARARF